MITFVSPELNRISVLCPFTSQTTATVTEGESLHAVHTVTGSPEHPAETNRPAQKRKRTSAARPSTSSADHLVQRPRSPIPPADLPLVSDEAPGPRPSTPPLQPDGDLNIYNRPVEEFQLIYHAVVDDMLKFKSGRPRPYSIELGRRLKQKLWERLDRPTFTETVDEDGRMHVDMSVGGDGVYPPLYDVDTSGEPAPGRPPVKRARK
nr:uncharacterized protein LOC114920388 [Labrus bergylta]